MRLAKALWQAGDHYPSAASKRCSPVSISQRFIFLSVKSKDLSFLVGKRLQFVTFYYEKGTICQFASNLTKLCHWNPRSVPIKDSKIPWPVGRFPGFYCPTQWSTASAIARIRISRQVL